MLIGTEYRVSSTELQVHFSFDALALGGGAFPLQLCRLEGTGYQAQVTVASVTLVDPRRTFSLMRTAFMRHDFTSTSMRS